MSRLLGVLGAIALVTALAACATVFSVVSGPGGLVTIPGLVSSKPIAAPVDLQQSVGDTGEPLVQGSWVRSSTVKLSFAPAPSDLGRRLVPEVEVRASDEPFQDEPTAFGGPLQAPSTRAIVLAQDLRDGERYHWQARFVDGFGMAGSWLVFGYPSVFDFGAVYQGPGRPGVQLEGVDDPAGATNQREPAVRLSPPAHPAGITGYAYLVERSPRTAPAESVNQTGNRFTLPRLPEGTSYLHVRAVDAAGNWGETTTTPIHVDLVPPAVEDAKYSDKGFNPRIDKLEFEFSIAKPATVNVVFYPQEGGSLPVRSIDLGKRLAFGIIRGEWDGRDEQGVQAPAGTYRFEVLATDVAGNVGRRTFRDIPLIDKRIVISVSQQKLVAYEGDRVIVSTLVTTGGPNLPTPVGTYHIISKHAPFMFRSPWPKSSPYWYEDALSNWAMLFEESGYFVHDAPWRGAFGPGTNQYSGRPGGNYTGTHGCVNVPYSVQRQLFPWTPVGTPVIVQQ